MYEISCYGMVLQNGWSFCQWLFMTLLDNFEYAGPSCSWILTCCLDFSLILLRIISKIIGANDGNRCQNILTILLRHLIWNWSCPTGWNCRNFFFIFLCFIDTFGQGLEPSTSVTSRSNFQCLLCQGGFETSGKHKTFKIFSSSFEYSSINRKILWKCMEILYKCNISQRNCFLIWKLCVFLMFRNLLDIVST